MIASPRPSSGALAGRRQLLLLAVAFALAAAGCAHVPAPPATRWVAVTPVDSLGLAAVEGDALRGSVETKLQQTQAHRALAREKLAGTGAEDARCRESEACLAELARKLPADYVLAMSLAGLGRTRLVRSRVVSSESGIMLQDLQETMAADPGALESFTSSLARRLFPEPEVKQPWYARGWIWALTGSALAATAVILTAGNAGVVHAGKL